MHAFRLIWFCVVFLALIGAAYGQETVYEDELVILSPHYEPQLKAYIEEFEKFAEADLGKNVSVRYVSMDTDDSFKRIFSNESQEDVIWGGGVALFMEAKERGDLERYVSKHDSYITTNITGLSLKDPQGYWYASAISGFGFMVNTRLLNKLALEKPKDWEDLLDEKYYGLIAFTKPSKSGSMHTLAELILQMRGQSAPEINPVSEGGRYFTDMKRNIGIMTDSSSASFNLVANGDYAIAPGIDYATYNYRRRGYPVEFIYPNTTYFSPDSIAIIKGAKNKNLARYFVDFVLSKIGQELTIREFYRIPVRSDIEIPEFLVNPNELRSNQFPLDLELSNDRYAEFMRFFDEEIIGHYKENRPIVKIRIVVDPQLYGLWEADEGGLRSGFYEHLGGEAVPYTLKLEITAKDIRDYKELERYDLYAPFSTYPLSDLVKQNPEIIRNSEYTGVPVSGDFSAMSYAKTPLLMVSKGDIERVLLSENEKAAVLYNYVLGENAPQKYEIVNVDAGIDEKFRMLESGKIDAFYASENEYIPYKSRVSVVKNKAMMLYMPLVMLHSPDVLLDEDKNVIEGNKKIQPYFDGVWYTDKKEKAITLLDQWLKSEAKPAIAQQGFRTTDYKWDGSGPYMDVEEFPADWSKMSKAFEAYNAASAPGKGYSDIGILVVILLFFLFIGIFFRIKKKRISGEKCTELVGLENERNRIKDMMRMTKIKYHKREIDEESFREIIRDYEKRLIEVEEKIKDVTV